MGVVADLRDIGITSYLPEFRLLMFDDYALRYEVVYYVLSADYNLYMDIQQAINFSLLEELSKRNIKFAMPVRALEFLEEVPMPKGHGFDQEAVPTTQPTSRLNEGSRKD